VGRGDTSWSMNHPSAHPADFVPHGVPWRDAWLGTDFPDYQYQVFSIPIRNAGEAPRPRDRLAGTSCPSPLALPGRLYSLQNYL